MQYRLINHKQRELTSKYLKDIYELKNDGAESIYGCVPNGEIGISIVLKGEGSVYKEGHWEKQAPVSIYGLIRKMQFNKMSRGYHEICIGFKPHLLQLFLRDNLSALVSDQATELADLINNNAVDRLFEDMHSFEDDRDLLIKIESFLRRHLIPQRYDERIFAAHDLIVHKNFRRVEELSNELNISSTGLRNLFANKMGISPKELIRIIRIKQALQLGRSDDESLTSMAYQLGYFDQSHFIHDFRTAIGITPKKYFENKNLTFDFYNYGRWRYDSFV